MSYGAEALQRALERLKRGMGVREVSRLYGIPSVRTETRIRAQTRIEIFGREYAKNEGGRENSEKAFACSLFGYFILLVYNFIKGLKDICRFHDDLKNISKERLHPSSDIMASATLSLM